MKEKDTWHVIAQGGNSDYNPKTWTPADLQNYSQKVLAWHKARDFNGNVWRDCKRKERIHWVTRAIAGFAWRLAVVAALALLIVRGC